MPEDESSEPGTTASSPDAVAGKKPDQGGGCGFLLIFLLVGVPLLLNWTLDIPLQQTFKFGKIFGWGVIKLGTALVVGFFGVLLLWAIVLELARGNSPLRPFVRYVGAILLLPPVTSIDDLVPASGEPIGGAPPEEKSIIPALVACLSIVLAGDALVSMRGVPPGQPAPAEIIYTAFGGTEFRQSDGTPGSIGSFLEMIKPPPSPPPFTDSDPDEVALHDELIRRLGDPGLQVKEIETAMQDPGISWLDIYLEWVFDIRTGREFKDAFAKELSLEEDGLLANALLARESTSFSDRILRDGITVAYVFCFAFVLWIPCRKAMSLKTACRTSFAIWATIWGISTLAYIASTFAVMIWASLIVSVIMQFLILQVWLIGGIPEPSRFPDPSNRYHDTTARAGSHRTPPRSG